nr:hypothetical protein [Tanacetum cinerariifolium]
MQQWLVQDDDDDFDAKNVYGYSATEVRYYHYLKPGTNLDYGLVALGGNQDLYIVKELGYSATEFRYFHYLKPRTNLDYDLVALGNYQNVKELLKYVVKNKVMDLYIEHGSSTLDTYFSGPRDEVLTDDNMPPSPSNIKGFTKLSLETPSSSKPLTICEEIHQSNPPLLRPGKILWVDREDYREDIGWGSSKGMETKVDASGSSKAKDPDAESHKKRILGEVEKETDIEIESDDDLEHEKEHFKVNDDRDGFLDEQNMIEDIAVDMQLFKDDIDRKEALVRRCDLKESHVDVIKADLDVSYLNSFGSDLVDGIDCEKRHMLIELRRKGKSISKGMFDFFFGSGLITYNLLSIRLEIIHEELEKA